MRVHKSAKPLDCGDFTDAYQTLIENSLQGFVIFQDGRMVFANSAISDLTGYTRDEVLAFSAREQANLIHPDDRELVLERMRQRLAGEPLPRVGDFRLLHKSGSTVWVRTLAQRVEFRGHPAIQSVYLDITEEVEAREQLRRATRAISALWHCNATLQHAVNETEMLQEVCCCLVRECGYVLAWVGYAEGDPDKTVRPVAEFGPGGGYADSVIVRWGVDAYSRGPSGKAVRSGIVHVCRDVTTEPDYEPWREQAQQQGYGSSIALPLKFDECVFGVLNLYASAPDAFDEEETRLLERLAADISYGIREARERTSLRESEAFNRTLLASIDEGVVVYDWELCYVGWNSFMEKLTGMPADQVLGQRALDLFPHLREQGVDALLARALAGETVRSQDTPFQVPTTGRTGWVVGIYSPHVDANGRIVGVVATIREITERKHAEESVRNSEAKYRQVVDNAAEAIFIAQDGYMTFANAATTRLLERTEEELASRPFPEFIHSEDRSMVIGRHQRRLAGEEVETGYEFRFVTGKGGVRWGRLNATRVEWQGRPATLNLVSDVTERREAEERLRRSQSATILCMGALAEARDPYTAGHQERVADLACAFASQMGLDEDTIGGLRVAALLHDIGKMSVPAEILSKPSKLTEIELSLVREHPRKAYEILKNIDFPWPIAEIILQHDERLDGSGYPQGLKGDAILHEAKILAVADVVEAMASHRPYRPALGIDAALEEIRSHRGTLYDSDVVEVCKQIFADGFQLVPAGGNPSH